MQISAVVKVIIQYLAVGYKTFFLTLLIRE